MGTEQDIFDSALEDDDADLPLAGEKGEVVPEKEGDTAPPPAKAEQAPETPPKAEEPPAAPADAQGQDEPKPVRHVPLDELLTTRERAQAAERERDELRRVFEQIQRQQAEQQKRQAQEVPDQFADPQAYTAWVLQQQRSIADQVRAEMRNEAVDASCEEAAEKHGPLFQEAFDALLRTNDPVLRDRLTSRPHRAGDQIVSWYKQQQVLREVGNDPSAYEAKLREKLLADEGFVAQVIERTRAQATQPSNGSRPQTVTRLPSLNRQTSVASDAADAGDDSEAAIFEAGRTPRRRRA